MTSRLIRAGAWAVLCLVSIPGAARAETLTGGIQVISLIRPTCRIAVAGRGLDDPSRTPVDGVELMMACTRGVFPSVTLEEERAVTGATIPRTSGVSRTNLTVVDRRLARRPHAPPGGRIGTVIATVHF